MIRLEPECIACLTRQHLGKDLSGLNKQEQIEYLQTVLAVIAGADRSHPAPVVVHAINSALKERFGIDSDFAHVKPHFNRLILDREAEFAARLAQAEDPLRLALQYAMIGNYIDFGARYEVKEEELSRLIETAGEQPLPEETYRALVRELEEAERLVFLTDNCGEIVFDKQLISLIRSRYPKLEITVIVRGGPVSNDASMEDARQVGLTDLVRVIGNGNTIAGTWQQALSPEAREAMDRADLILSKGQANFETLRGCGRNIYYLFLCKCQMFARKFGVPRFTGMLVNDSACRE